MGWLITCGILTLLAVLPLGVRIRYDGAGPLVRVILGPVKITVFPRPKKEKKARKEKEQEKEIEEQVRPEKEDLPQPPQPPKEKTPQTEKKGGSLKDFLPFVKLGLDFLGDFRRKLRLDDLYLRLILASSDPCSSCISTTSSAWAISIFSGRFSMPFFFSTSRISLPRPTRMIWAP